jgi:competence protein ComEC
MWVTALDVGQGMAMLVETRDAVLLYDTGPRYSSQADAGERVILPYLRWRGIERVDLMIVSHLDSDHSGGAASILSAMPVARVLTSINPAHPALGGASGVERCEAGQHIMQGALEVRVLHPAADDYGNPGATTNGLSCVADAGIGAAHVLLTGDIPAREEARLIARSALQTTSLATAPHHGSRHSSSEAFIEAAAPRWVVVQAGYRNRFAHPDPGVVERYLRRGAQLVRTDHDGATQWRWRRDGSTEMESWRRQHARYWHNRPSRPMLVPDVGTVGADEPSEGTMHPVETPQPFEAWAHRLLD